MEQKRLFELAKIAYLQKTAEAKKGEAQRFERIKALVRDEGVYTGTSHKRIVIPKSKISEGTLKRLGFENSMIAVPETGQDKWISLRHPENNFHIHSHGENWTIHEDRHPSSQMLASKATQVRKKLTAYAEGLPHLITEGIPGTYIYGKGVITKRKSTAEKINEELSHSTKRKIRRWKSEDSAS